MIRPSILALLFLVLTGCGSGADATSGAAPEPGEPGPAECAVCGMVVAEQPAPRGQAAHRGGEQRFFCSLGDLRAWLETPGPLGRPEAVWVEALPAGADGAGRDATPRPWIPADQAVHVVGIQRPAVMGAPVLSFDSAGAAEAAAARPGARVVTWEALRTTPFNQLPKEAP